MEMRIPSGAGTNQKQLRCEIYFYCVFIIVRGITTIRSPLTTLFYIIHLWTFIQLTRFYSVSVFNEFIPLVSIHAVTRVKYVYVFNVSIVLFFLLQRV